MLRVGLYLEEGFQPMSLAPLSVLEAANNQLKERPYEPAIVSANGGRVRSSLGLEIETAKLADGAFDTLLICVAPRSDTPLRRGACHAALREQATAVRRTGSIGSGTLVLAETGLLDGRRTAIHRMYAQELQARFPAVKVEPDCSYMTDGPMWTCSGMAAGIEMVIAMVEKDFGSDVSRSAAYSLAFPQRGEIDVVRNAIPIDQPPRQDRVKTALTHAALNLRKNLTVEVLAEIAHLSPRHFTRVFRSQTGQSPAKAIEGLRLEAARFRVEHGHQSIEEIAIETGFGDRERMRRAFVRAYGQTPAQLRMASRLASTLQPACVGTALRAARG